MSKSSLQPLITAKPQLTEIVTPQKHHVPHWKRKLAAVSRWLHIYLSMGSFGVLFFFAVTGLTLNHTEWFGNKQSVTQRKGSVDLKWLNPKDVAKLEIVEQLRATGVKGALSDFRIDGAQIGVSFKGPAYTADAFIDRETGKYDLTETRMGFVAVINDLHKGRDSGRAWSLVIDLSAALMVFVSLSGLVLMFYLHKRRASGLIALACGAALCWLVYAVWVP